MAEIIYAQGGTEPIKPKNGTDFQLEELREIVGGYIEVTYTKSGKLMIVNEEGKLIGLPFNPVATMLHKYNDEIVGDVLVCEPSEVK